MRETVISFMNKHQLIQRGKTAIVGVSGGPDSMALLHFFRSIQAEWKLRLIAVSVDHQLRGEESREDLLYVERMCREWGIEFHGKTVDVESHKQANGTGTEAAARELRYQAFAETMTAVQADYVILGHHGDDQIETMLMRLVRSTNTRALAGIPYRRPFACGAIIRPFLCITKETIEHYCQENRIIPRRDPTNEETIYTRNYFRKMILPLIKTQNRNIHTTMQHLSESIREDARQLEIDAEKLFPGVVQLDHTTKQASFKIDAFLTHPTALQRRFFHLILNYLYNELPKDVSYVHMDQFFALLANRNANVRIDFPGELKVEKAYKHVRFYFQSDNEIPAVKETLNIPGEIHLPDGSFFRAVLTDTAADAGVNCYVCGKEEVALPLHIRTRQPGDRMSWKGLNGTKKLKDIFIDAKIPIIERDKWPVMTDNNGEILWLAGLKKKEAEKRSDSTSYINVYFDKGNI